MELDDLPKERLKQLIYEETASFVAKTGIPPQNPQPQNTANNEEEPMQ